MKKNKHKTSTLSSQNGAHTIPTTSPQPNPSKNPNHRLTRSTRRNPTPPTRPTMTSTPIPRSMRESAGKLEWKRRGLCRAIGVMNSRRMLLLRCIGVTVAPLLILDACVDFLMQEKKRSRKVASVRDVTTSVKGISPATPLPDKELPDYLEIVENPMDFSAIRNKLDGGLYFSLEQLEADVYLICTNAMRYNAPSTMFFRQARSIQALAQVEFDKLRQGGDTPEEQCNSNIEPLPKPRRATPATEGGDVSRLSHYNLRNGPSFLKHNNVDESSRVLNVGRIVESRSKSPGSLDHGQWAEKDSSQMVSSSKSCRTQFEHEGSRRSAHSQPVLLPTNGDLSAPRTVGEEIQQLVPVELLSHHGYARSLARFAADLGPVARKIASKKIRTILSPGVEFGPGWFGGRVESSACQSIPSEPTSSNTNYTYDISRLHRPSTSDLYNAFL
ncbi:Bromodomain and PHD finger-containing protein [Drosera capensis]